MLYTLHYVLLHAILYRLYLTESRAVDDHAEVEELIVRYTLIFTLYTL